MGGEGIPHVMIGFGTGEVNFMTGGTLFVVTSFLSSDSQKKDTSHSAFRYGDADKAVTLDGETFSSMCLVFCIPEEKQSKFRLHGLFHRYHIVKRERTANGMPSTAGSMISFFLQRMCRSASCDDC